MSRFDLFIRERRHLHNVSEHTVSWYTHALKWLPCERPTQEQLKEVVLQMRRLVPIVEGQLVAKADGCHLRRVVRRVEAFTGGASARAGSARANPCSLGANAGSTAVLWGRSPR